MDTRYWGPSGWKLLHLIAFDYEYSAASAITYANFFETIPYILPCKFCRSSLTDYYKLHPYTPSSLSNGYMDPKLDLKRWMYTIHNCVNNKLRKQGIPTGSNPPYTQVIKRFESMRQMPWEAQLAACWDFLFSVAYHYPKYIKIEPMPGSPEYCDTECEKNKWNVLPVKERMNWFQRFWMLLPDVLPSEMGQRWRNARISPDLRSRATTLAWLWKMRCALDPHFKDPYTAICKHVKSYSSDCKHRHTCRKKQYTKKK